MTIKEIAETLGKDESTIRKIGKELFPSSFQNGIKTELTEIQTTAIKLNLGNNSELPKTTLEKQLLIRQAMFLQDEMITELQKQLEDAKPKIEVYDKFLTHENFINFRDAAASIGLTQTKFMDFLRTKYIYKNSNNEYRAYNDYQIYFSLRPFTSGSIIGNQLMLTISGIAFFNRLINKENK